MGGRKKKHERAADLAAVYHIDPYQLTPTQQIGLYANLRRVQAQRQIQAGQLEGLDHTAIFNLYLTAYGDERLANDARRVFLEKYVEQSCQSHAAQKTR